MFDSRCLLGRPRPKSELKISRAMISNHPAFGGLGTILNTPALYQECVEQLQSMAYRIIEIGKSRNIEIDKIGMFSITGLNFFYHALSSLVSGAHSVGILSKHIVNQVKFLKEKYHTYMTDNHVPDG